MNIIDIIQLNYYLKEKFTHEQLVDIINVCYENDKLLFDRSVENFYIDIMDFDKDNAYNIIRDICHGDKDAFVRFAEDINYYCNENHE